MTPDERRLRTGFDDLLVVVDDGVDGEALKSLWVRADIFDCSIIDTRPARCEDGVSEFLIVDAPAFPAGWSHPQAVY